jgi:hypothetical protein
VGWTSKQLPFGGVEIVVTGLLSAVLITPMTGGNNRGISLPPAAAWYDELGKKSSQMARKIVDSSVSGNWF